MLIRRSARSSSREIWISSRRTRPSDRETRGSMVRRKASGCSKISRIRWCGNLRVSAITLLNQSSCRGAFHSADKSPQHFALVAEDNEVRVGSSRENTLIGDSRHPRWILAGRRNRGCQVPFRETDEIAYGAIHGQHASGQLAVDHALAVSNVHFEGAKAITALRHSGCRDCIRDENSLSRAFGL